MVISVSHRGFTLIEILIAMLLASILITGITQLAIATGGSYRLQQNLGFLQESARFAFSTIRREIEAAGYQRKPWEPGTGIRALGDQTAEALTLSSDRVSIQKCSCSPDYCSPHGEHLYSI